MSNQSFFKTFWKLAKPYWVSSESGTAYGLLLLVIVLTLSSVFMYIEFNDWNRLMFDAIQHFDKARLLPLAWRFTWIVFSIILINVYNRFLTQVLEVRWRRWMTQVKLTDWMQKHHFYLIQISEKNLENPDQRIAEDIKEFVNLTLNLSIGLIQQLVTLVSFLRILWTISGVVVFDFLGIHFWIPGYLAFVALLYSIVGSFVTYYLGRGLTEINYQQQRYEADFRFNLIRVRENSESIALSSLEEGEIKSLKKKFDFIYENFFQLIKKQKKIGFFTVLFSNASQLVPMMCVMPRYFSKAIELGNLMQTISAFGSVEAAFSWFVHNYIGLSYWRSVIQRLTGFDECIRHVELLEPFNSHFTNEDSSCIRVQELTIRLPSQEVLLSHLNFELPVGSWVLLHGPSGCGKSTLLRSLAGVWPFIDGNISMPKHKKILFVPQKSYLSLVSLKEILTGSDFKGDPSTIIEWLNFCHLQELGDQLNRIENWSHILSSGEQQALAFVRIFLQKPDILFLDEVTSALDEEAQTKFYKEIAHQLPGVTVVSVAHRPSLIPLHSLHFDLVSQTWLTQ